MHALLLEGCKQRFWKLPGGEEMLQRCSVWQILLLMVLISRPGRCFNHWVVTEDGKIEHQVSWGCVPLNQSPWAIHWSSLENCNYIEFTSGTFGPLQQHLYPPLPVRPSSLFMASPVASIAEVSLPARIDLLTVQTANKNCKASSSNCSAYLDRNDQTKCD